MDQSPNPFDADTFDANPFDGRRRAPRVGIELMVRCKHGRVRSTVMLKDMTRFGARIEGLHALEEGEAISLMLPDEAPRLAFVMWTGAAVAGLEFADPLPPHRFDALIRDFAIGCQPAPVPPPGPIRAAA
jgi:hypothetical protein